jgi:peptidoglycan/xylan/chitin deacetylase (PgdA/CDA1 family)
MKKYALWTNDVETTSIWLNTLRDETGRRVWKEGMPILLDIYQKYQIKSTFFFTGYIARLYPEMVKMVQKDGHEIGSHSFSHKKEDGLDRLSYQEQLYQLQTSKKILEDISGEEVISFRAPALRVSPSTASALIESGYLIDSSIAAQRFDLFMSFGGVKKLRWLFAPRCPYRVDARNIFRKGDSPLVEVPLSASIMPYTSTTMRVFPRFTSLQRYLLQVEAAFSGKPIVFDIHPNEFIDESGEERRIEKRSANWFAYLIQDVLRARLKARNLGLAAVPLYEREIAFFERKAYRFTTMKSYCREMGLIPQAQLLTEKT